jgi:nucleoside-diphosphate-sugar epimerase
MQVLVTGHRGYIGKVMVLMLLKAGHEVTGCDSDLYGRCTFDNGGPIAAVPSIRKDVRTTLNHLALVEARGDACQMARAEGLPPAEDEPTELLP